MRTPGFKEELERRRRLGVSHVLAGYRQRTVAKFLGVCPSTVCRWMKAYRRGGDRALAGRDPSGRPPKLTRAQERQVLGWFRHSPKDFGFPTELWTAARVAYVIRRKWRIKFHPRYLSQWVAERRITPQKPRLQAREHDEVEVQRWLREEWPRIKKVRRGDGRTWF